MTDDYIDSDGRDDFDTDDTATDPPPWMAEGKSVLPAGISLTAMPAPTEPAKTGPEDDAADPEEENTAHSTEDAEGDPDPDTDTDTDSAGTGTTGAEDDPESPWGDPTAENIADEQAAADLEAAIAAQMADDERAEREDYIRTEARRRRRKAQGLNPDTDPYAGRIKTGASFILDQPKNVPAIWGTGRRVLWQVGEALMIAGGSGVGKTRIAGQLVRASLGLSTTGVLDLPVTECQRVFYLAMDRPKQASRLFSLMFTDAERSVLHDRLTILEGPPINDIAKNPEHLLELCERAGLREGDRLIVDSLKDAAIGLSEDAVGAGYNRARQTVIAAGIDILELHHMTKRASDGGPPKSIADVYGSAWLGNGAGSVIYLHGEPGDIIIGFKHLKQPDDVVGPFDIQHLPNGDSVVDHTDADPVQIIAVRSPAGMTAREITCIVNNKSTPSKADIERIRQRLEKLTDEGHLTKFQHNSVNTWKVTAPTPTDDE